MDCHNHPGVEAKARCAGCAEDFCERCLVTVHGQPYCAACKMLTVNHPPVVESATTPCTKAGEATIFALVGALCALGVVFGPLAINSALQARRAIAADPRLSGWGKANAALIVGVIETLLGLVFAYSVVTNMGQQ